MKKRSMSSSPQGPGIGFALRRVRGYFFSVFGWIRNLRTGQVELLAAGEKVLAT